jgi:hypothetical protein
MVSCSYARLTLFASAKRRNSRLSVDNVRAALPRWLNYQSLKSANVAVGSPPKFEKYFFGLLVAEHSTEFRDKRYVLDAYLVGHIVMTPARGRVTAAQPVLRYCSVELG